MIAKTANTPVLLRFVDRRTLQQIARYVMTGCSSAVIEVALFAFVADVLLVGIQPPAINSDPQIYSDLIQQLMAMGIIVPEKMNVFYANAISLTVAFWFTFLVNRVFSFRSKAPILGQLGIYTPLFCFNLVATSLIVGFLVNSLDMLPVLAKAMSIGCVVSWNFLIYKLLIFR